MTEGYYFFFTIVIFDEIELFLSGYVPRAFAVVDLRIPHAFPQSLLDRRTENGSVHASSVFNHDEDGTLRVWFQQRLLNIGIWEDCPHPPDVAIIAPDARHNFRHYIQEIEALDLKVWSIESDRGSNMYLNLHDSHGRLVVLAGRPDYLISASATTRANFLENTKCVIEVQSQENLDRCEYQIQLYLLILMNIRGLTNVYGFLVRLDGNCRAYRAFRGAEGDCMYEENDVFHVSHLANVIRMLLPNPLV